jgi:glycosyltransferase involved in cell wall biosynthesis/spore maturation protein CgeB
MIKNKWRVLLLDTKESNPNHYICIAIEDALKNHPSVEFVRSAGYGDALNAAIHERCNLFFAWDGEGLDRGLCQRLSVVCGKSVLWVTEDPYENTVNVDNSSLFDFVFTNDLSSVGSYHGNIYHLPFAAYPRFHYHEIPGKDEGYYLYDLLFVGTAWPNRTRLLKTLLSDLKGIKVKIALPYNEDTPKPDLGLPESTYLWKMSNSELARMANRSRIVLTLHRDYSLSGNKTMASTPGPRLFETALAGGFQLVDLTLPETTKYFSDENEIAGFQLQGECMEQIRYFLAHSEERITMARKAQNRCLAEHLYKHRIERILEIVEKSTSVYESTRRETSIMTRGKIRILHVAHNYISVPHFGGVEVYVDRLVRHLPAEYESLVYYPNRLEPEQREVILLNTVTRSEKRHTFECGYDPSTVTDPEREIWFSKLLHEERIDIAHFHHLIYHPLSLPLVARSMGIPVIMSLPDFYPVCPHYNLIDNEKRYCNITMLPAVACDICLELQDEAIKGSQSSRRSFISGVLENVDLIIFLSHSEYEIVKSVYPFLRDSSRILVEGYPVIEKELSLNERGVGGVLKVAVPGNFHYEKGGDVLCRIFDMMRKDEIEFHVYGFVPPPYSEKLKDLNLNNVRIYGAYSADTIDERLQEADVSLHLSIWPETYVLTLSESWMAGVVPIVTDIGALGERVEDRVTGFKVPVGDPATVIQVLRELIADRSELKRIRKNIQRGLYCKLDEHIKIISGVYGRFIEEYRLKDRKETYFSEFPAARPASAGNMYRNKPTWLYVNHEKQPEEKQRYGFRNLLVDSMRKLRQVYHK